MTPPVSQGARSSPWPDYEVAAINAARIAGRTEDEIRELVKLLVAERKNALWMVAPELHVALETVVPDPEKHVRSQKEPQT